MKLLPLVFSAASADKNGGAACAACGIIGGWLEQYGSANGKSGSETIADMCRFLPTDLERGKFLESGFETYFCGVLLKYYYTFYVLHLNFLLTKLI